MNYITRNEAIPASHPSRVRGLKLLVVVFRNVDDKSHPSRVRGLKLKVTNLANRFTASRTLHGCVD